MPSDQPPPPASDPASAEPPPPRRFSWKRAALGAGLALLAMLAVGGWWLATSGVQRVLESQSTREKAARRTAGLLNAPSGYLPFQVQGDTARCPLLFARGLPGESLTFLEARDLKARSHWLAGLWHKAIRVESLRVAGLRAAYGEAGAKLLPPGATPAPAPPPLLSADHQPGGIHVDFDRADVDRLDFAWGDAPGAAGGILGAKAECVTEGQGALRVALAGGEFRQSGWPALALDSAHARFQRPVLRVEEAKLRLPAGQGGDGGDGQVTAAGELRFDGPRPLTVQLQLSHCPVAPLVSPETRARLDGGRFDGEIKIERALGDDQAPTRASGSLAAADAALHGLKMLDQVAELTRRAEFRRLRLRRVRGQFDWDGQRLAVRDFEADAGKEKLLRAEGEFEVAGERIRGTFQLGVIPALLADIPGAREQVFTHERDGYAWTRVQVSGSLAHPEQDLRGRLVKAAEEATAKKFLGPLFGPGKSVLKLLRGLGDGLD